MNGSKSEPASGVIPAIPEATTNNTPAKQFTQAQMASPGDTETMRRVYEALERIQYPQALHEPAARHLLRVKVLADDFSDYIHEGMPPVQPFGQAQPPSLSRSLP